MTSTTTRRTAALAVLLFTLTAPLAGAQAGKSMAKAGMSDADALIAHEKALYTSLEKGDFAGFNKGVGADFVSVDAMSGPMVWELAKTADMLKGCKMSHFSVDNPKATAVGNDIYVVTATVSGDDVCDGMKGPSPVWTMSVWQKRGGRWMGLAHSETPVPPKK
jgi:hypothetical protein